MNGNKVMNGCEVELAGYRWVATRASGSSYAVERSWGDGQQTEDMGSIRRIVNGWRTPDDERCDSVRAALWSFAARCVARELRLSGGYFYRELEAAFRRVRPQDWKGPIRASIDASVLPVTAAAVEWFTGTKLQVLGETVAENGRRILDVAADGYRAGPCGDH